MVMKYRLAKDIPGMGNKGDEFELTELNRIVYVNPLDFFKNRVTGVQPHELALLLHCGLLEEVEEEKPFTEEDYQRHHQFTGTLACTCQKCAEYSTSVFEKRLVETMKSKIQLWEEMPRRGKMIWVINTSGEVVEIEILGANREKFLLKSKNMHKTRESAEEALRLIMES